MREVPGQLGLEAGLRGRYLELASVRRQRAALLDDRPQRSRRRSRDAHEAALRIDPDAQLVRPAERVRRQRVVHLVRDDRTADRLELVEGDVAGAREPGALARSERLRALAQDEPQRQVGERTCERGRERSVAGADLADRERIGASERVPARTQVGRERLGEERHERRHGREGAAPADPRPACVEAVVGVVQRGLHEGREGDRPVPCDPGAQPVAEHAQGVNV